VLRRTPPGRSPFTSAGAIRALAAAAVTLGLIACQRPPGETASKDPARADNVDKGIAAQPKRDPLLEQTVRFNRSAWNLPDEELLGFVQIPAGPFTMGSDKAKDKYTRENELPQHQVTLVAFFIGRYEVTVAQYKACASDGGCRPAERNALAGRDDLPVRFVSWHEAVAYCSWLERKLTTWNGAPNAVVDSLAGRLGPGTWHVALPSEAEWERAARGTDARIYPWGNEIDSTKANYTEANRDVPMPVGAFSAGASPYGLIDLSGNVSEWTRSQFRPYPFRVDDGRDGADAPDSVPRVVRGGSFQNDETNVRAASRFRDNPTGRSDFIGFRVAVSRF
jgi:formylglycine-generating enzyme required for sulfatase activity